MNFNLNSRLSAPTDCHSPSSDPAGGGGGRRAAVLGLVWLLGVLGLWVGVVPGVSAAAPGASRFAIQVKDADDGLPHPSVIAMTQTRDGYLWLGTLNGLVRYDGFSFRVFDENNTPGLNSSRIVFLFEDSQRVLWIGTETAGIVLWKDGQIVAPPQLALGGSEKRLVSACEDAEGAVWLGNADGEIWRHRDGRFTPFVILPVTPSRAHFLIAENAGPVWVGTDTRQREVGKVSDPAPPDGGLPVVRELPLRGLDFLLPSRRGGYWRLEGGTIQRWASAEQAASTVPVRYPWGAAKIQAACEDLGGHLIVGTLGAGVFWFDDQGSSTQLSTADGLSNDYILSLVMDHEGTLWVGTDGGGLNRVKRKVLALLPETRDWVVQSVAEDADGLWIASNNNGVGHWSEGGGLVRDPVFRSNTSTRCVLVDRQRRVYLGTPLDGLLLRQNETFLPVASSVPIYRKVNALFESQTGILSVGTDGGLIQYGAGRWTLRTTAGGLSADAVTCFAEQGTNGLWIGTRGGGLNLLEDDRVTVFRRREGELPSDDVSSIVVDRDGVPWVGTSSGLARWKDGRWTRISAADGLASDSITYLLDDVQGSLWVGSNKGLMQIAWARLNDFADGRATFLSTRVFRREDGLPSANCTAGSQPAACRSQDGRLWFPTIKGLVWLSPADLRPNTNPPPVIIESVQIEGGPSIVPVAGSPVPIPAGRERVEIRYTSLNLGASERAVFRYRLEGHEAGWTHAGNVRVVRYSRLPPGDYRFLVSACNEDGVWNETGAAVALVVLPPYWATWWFRTLGALVVLGVVGGIVFYLSTQRLQRQLATMKQQEALEKERARIARDIHDQLGASLTQVALLGELVETDKNSPAEIEEHARQICQTARDTTRTLDEIVWTVNPSNDTLEGVVNYVCKYAQEYLAVAGLKYRLEIPPHLPEASVAPEVRHNIFLAAKEAVTNIVRHAHASSAWLRLQLASHEFTLEIADDGRGLAGMDAARAATRNGLTNMRRRMEDVGGRFEFAQRSEGGTSVRLTAPIRPGSPRTAPPAGGQAR